MPTLDPSAFERASQTSSYLVRSQRVGSLRGSATPRELTHMSTPGSGRWYRLGTVRPFGGAH
jgi:hypothetical protein